jgi:hypothetical protein
LPEPEYGELARFYITQDYSGNQITRYREKDVNTNKAPAYRVNAQMKQNDTQYRYRSEAIYFLTILNNSNLP